MAFEHTTPAHRPERLGLYFIAKLQTRILYMKEQEESRSEYLCVREADFMNVVP